MRLLAVLGAAVALAPAASSAPATGLYGLLMRSPTRPVCVAELPCSAPVRGAMLVFSRNGRVVGRATTGVKGAYRVELPPGRYGVRVERRWFTKRLSPLTVSVPRGAFARVNFMVDTGIR